MGEMRILGPEGDKKEIWDPSNEDEVESARATFNRLTKKGYKAFEVGAGGKKSSREITEFDPDLGKMILVQPVAGG